jgi:hypothetical protein
MRPRLGVIGDAVLTSRNMAERLPRLIVHYPDGVLSDGVCWVSLGSRSGDRRTTDRYYQNQFDDQGFVPVEGANILMRDREGDLSDEVGVLHWNEGVGWSLKLDPWTQS